MADQIGIERRELRSRVDRRARTMNRFTVSVICSAPGGATVVGSEMTPPPGCARGASGSVNRSRSRPGCALGGIT